MVFLGSYIIHNDVALHIIQ